MRTSLVLIAGFLIAVPSIAQDKPARILKVTAPLATSPNTLMPVGQFEIGSVRVSQVMPVQVELLNTTSTELNFDNVHLSSGKILSPKKGQIAPGEKLLFAIEVRIVGFPRSANGGGFIQFLDQGQFVFSVRFTYKLSRFVGIASKIVTVKISGEADSNKVQIVAPIVVGEELNDDDFEVSVEKIAGDFSYEVNRTEGVLRGWLELDGELEFDRLYGSLDIIDLASGLLRSTPLVIERSVAVNVYPGSLEFVPSSDDEPYVAKVYVRPRELTKDHQPRCAVRAKIADERLACVTTELGSGIFQGVIKITPEQVDMLVAEGRAAADADSELSPDIVDISVDYDSSKIQEQVPYSVRGVRGLQQSAIGNSVLIDAIETGVTVGHSLSPFELVGTTTKTDEFDNEMEVSGTTQFRLQYDRERETVIWAIEQKPDPFQALGIGPATKESVRYHCVVIQGSKSLDPRTSSRSSPQVYESFEQAATQSSIPLPMYWGLSKFPTFEDPVEAIRSLAARSADESSRVSVSRVQDGARYVLRENHTPIRFDVRQWEFELPNFSPTFAKVERAINGDLVPYFVQQLQWQTVMGHDVPVKISSEGVKLRPTPAGKVKYQFGKLFTDTDITWLRVRKSSPQTQSPPNLGTPAAIKKFIDEGAELAAGR